MGECFQDFQKVSIESQPQNAEFSPADNRHNISEPGFAVYRKCFD